MLKKIVSALPHISIVLALMILVFLIIDKINPAMNFINNGGTKTLLGILCVLNIIACILLSALLRRRK